MGKKYFNRNKKYFLVIRNLVQGIEIEIYLSFLLLKFAKLPGDERKSSPSLAEEKNHNNKSF
jgi:hypothetical protein